MGCTHPLHSQAVGWYVPAESQGPVNNNKINYLTQRSNGKTQHVARAELKEAALKM